MLGGGGSKCCGGCAYNDGYRYGGSKSGGIGGKPDEDDGVPICTPCGSNKSTEYVMNEKIN